MSQNAALIYLGHDLQRSYQAWLFACGTWGLEAFEQLNSRLLQLGADMEIPPTAQRSSPEVALAKFFSSGFEPAEAPSSADWTTEAPGFDTPTQPTATQRETALAAAAHTASVYTGEKQPTAAAPIPRLTPPDSNTRSTQSIHSQRDTPQQTPPARHPESTDSLDLRGGHDSPAEHDIAARSHSSAKPAFSFQPETPPPSTLHPQNHPPLRSDFQPMRSLTDWASQVSLSQQDKASQPTARSIFDDSPDSRSRSSAPPAAPVFLEKNAPGPDASANASRTSKPAPPSEKPHPEDEPRRPWWSLLPDDRQAQTQPPTHPGKPTLAAPGWAIWEETTDSMPHSQTLSLAPSERLFTQNEMPPMSAAFYPETQNAETAPSQPFDFHHFNSVRDRPADTEEILQTLTQALTEDYRRYYGHL